MGRYLGEAESVAGRHFYGDAFQFLANFRREPKEACLRVVPTFVQGAAMEAGGDLQAAVVFGNRLERHPDGGDVDLLGVAIVLCVLVPGGLGPDLVGQFGAGIEAAVDGDFGCAEEVLRQGEERGVYQKIKHFATYEVAAGAADIFWPAGDLPNLQ